jgi:hypothetical protein
MGGKFRVSPNMAIMRYAANLPYSYRPLYAPDIPLKEDKTRCFFVSLKPI